MKAFLALLFFCLLNGTVCILLREKFGRCIPSTLIVSPIILFLSQAFFQTFNVGLAFLTILACTCPFLYFFYRGGKKANHDLVFSGGFYSFLAIFLVFFVIDYHRSLSLWDELMHWGKMVKEMYRLDQFYTVPESTLFRHKDYPPFMPLFELLWCKITGAYSESIISQSVHVFMLSLLTPYLIEDFDKHKKTAFIWGILSVIFYSSIIIILDKYGTFNSIYMDIFIGVVFAYSVILILSGRAFAGFIGFGQYVLSLAALISIKQIGITFLLISLFLYISFLIKHNKNLLDRIIYSTIAVLIPAISYLWWGKFVKSYQIAGQFDVNNLISKVMIGQIIHLTGFEKETLRRFIIAIFDNNITMSPIAITFLSSLLILFLLLEFEYMKNHREGDHLFNLRVLQLALVGGGIGYALVMGILYLFCFERPEMIRLGSFPRYMSSYFTGAMLVVIYLLIVRHKDFIQHKITTQKFLLLILCGVVLFSSPIIRHMIPQKIYGDPMYHYRQVAGHLDPYVEAGDKVYVVYKMKNGDDYQVFLSYYMNGAFIDPTYFNLADSNFNQNNTLKKKFEDNLRKDDYLFVVQLDDTINKNLSVYNGGNKLKERSVYKVMHVKGNIILSEVSKPVKP